MSFILDALKKSESERQQQHTTEFTSVPIGPRSTAAPRWMWIVGALLTINLAVIVGLLMRQDNDVNPVVDNPTPFDTTTQNATNNNRVDPSFTDRIATARHDEPRRQTEANDEHVATATTAAASVISETRRASPSTEVYPTIHAVRANGTITIPELHLDIHVYSDVPKDRFVFINMTKHREGSQLAEGPVVDSITPEGVVLGHKGLFFLLPRD